MEDKFLLPDEVCAYLKISQSTLNRIVLDGDLPVYKVRGGRRYLLSDVNTYVANCRQAAIAPGIKIPRAKGTSTRTRECRYVPGMKVV